MNGPAAIPTVVTAIHDGYYCCGTGAGWSNRAFVEVLAQIRRPGTRLAVLPVYLSATCAEYDRRCHAHAAALIEGAGGQIFPVSNGSGGQVRFGGPANFRAASASAASIINRHILPRARPLLIVGFDVPFLGLADDLAPTARGSLVVVPRSTAALQAPGDRDRLSWEIAGLRATFTTGGRIAAISAHMRHHLTAAYQVPHAAVVDLPDGLIRSERQPASPDQAALLPAPARTGFLLTMGRAVACKGFDDLIDALAIVTASGTSVPHAIVAAVTETASPTEYQEHLARKMTDAGVDATLITRHDPQLRGLLAHPALAAVVVPSRAEPFGRIPLEAFAAGAAPVIATTAGGLCEQVIDGVNGFTAQPGDPRSLAAALRQALTCTPTERAQLREAGHRTLARYSYEASITRFMATVAPWAIRTG